MNLPSELMSQTTVQLDLSSGSGNELKSRLFSWWPPWPHTGCVDVIILFVLIPYVLVNSLCRDWFHGWTSAKQRIKCLVQIHNAEPLVRLEPATPQSLHWATQLRNVTIQVNIMSCVLHRVPILSDTSHINCMVARCLINRGYLLF